MMAGGIEINNEDHNMKKILLSALLIAPMAYADDWTPPITHSLTIISEKELKTPPQLKEENLKRQKAMKLQGYVREESRYAKFLLGLKAHSSDEIKAFRGSPKEDTHLKKTVDEIELAFSLKKLPIDDSAIIGYAPIGSYVAQPKKGWNGLKAFFEMNNAICAYEFTDLKLSNGGVIMTKEGLEYLVNNKPTVMSAEGSDASGYTYSITWYNDIKVSRLDCATKSFRKELPSKMLALSRKIDSKLFN